MPDKSRSKCSAFLFRQPTRRRRDQDDGVQFEARCVDKQTPGYGSMTGVARYARPVRTERFTTGDYKNGKGMPNRQAPATRAGKR